MSPDASPSKCLTRGGNSGDRIRGPDRTHYRSSTREFGEGLSNICAAIATCAKKFPEVLFVYPVHPNPIVLGQVHEWLSDLGNVLLLQPLDYPTFVYLMHSCYLIVTDSGGIQEEAPALKKPVIVTREKTERQEAVETGQVYLAGTQRASIADAIESLLICPDRYLRMACGGSPYGDGNSAVRIVEIPPSS